MKTLQHLEKKLVGVTSFKVGKVCSDNKEKEVRVTFLYRDH